MMYYRMAVVAAKLVIATKNRLPLLCSEAGLMSAEEEL